VVISGDLRSLLDAEAEVAVDFTHPDAVMKTIRWAIENGVNMVVGTTGISPRDLEEIRAAITAAGERSNVFVAPNFAIGAVLAERFGAEASKYFPAVEIIELHHEGKADAPSGTALSAARAIRDAKTSEFRGPDSESLAGSRGGDAGGIRVHSVRLPGLVAHQEIILGGKGQTLTIRHDSTDRSSFMPGVVMAVKAVGERRGLTVGLGSLLE
jgi:4-hydroxy-tetrahydrodipicolinate reductase